MSLRPAAVSRVELDPAADAAHRAQRLRRLNTVEIPALRLVGMALLAVCVLLHNRFVLGDVALAASVGVTVFLLGYSALAWLALWRWWGRLGAVDLGLAFLVLDLGVWTVAVYHTGGERSWLFVVLLVRVADQVNTSFARAAAFAHLAAAAYLGLLGYVALADGRAIAWPAELAKASILYLGGLYIALAARTAERRRRQVGAAVHLARETVQRLAERTGELEAQTRELEQRTRDLEQARVRAEEAGRARRRFFALMSHELRTPLSAIMGFSRLLLRGDEGPLTDKQAAYVRTVETNGGRLLHLIDAVLEVAGVDPDRLRLEAQDVDVRALVETCVAESRALVGDRPLTVECDLPPTLPAVCGDAGKLRQIVLGLLSNAIRFTPRGRVIVRARPAPEGIHLAVADTGVGIAEADLARVFDPFYRVERAAATEATGAGLGLAISKMYVELHGGWIWAESRLHSGSTFHVTLPLRPPTLT